MRKSDRNFANRYLTIFISSAISLITLIISATQIYVAEVNKTNALELAKIQKNKELQIVKKNNLMKWKLDLASFIAKNKDFVFSSNIQDRIKIRDVMILTFPADIVQAVFQDLTSTVPRSEKETWSEGIEIINKLRPEYIIIHSAASESKNIDVELIDRWHKQRGWSEIGYHFLITDDRHEQYPDGTVQEGRSLNKVGAHTRGLNKKSIGIVLAGHGDKRDLTSKQKEALHKLILSLIKKFPEIKIDNVLGHNEVNILVDRGIIEERFANFTTSDQGSKVDMNEIREGLRSDL
jgi:hypothetical protein